VKRKTKQTNQLGKYRPQVEDLPVTDKINRSEEGVTERWQLSAAFECLRVRMQIMSRRNSAWRAQRRRAEFAAGL